MAYKKEIRKSKEIVAMIPDKALSKAEQELFGGIIWKCLDQWWDYKADDIQKLDEYKFNLPASELQKLLKIDKAQFSRTLVSSHKKIHNLSYLISNDEIQDGIPVFRRMTLNKKTNSFTIKFNEDYLNHLLVVKKDFIKISLEQLFAFKSKYTQPIYDLLKSKVSIDNNLNFNLELELLRKHLFLGTKYKAFRDLNRDVLTPILKDLSSSDLKVKMTKLAIQRKVYALNFNGMLVIPEEKDKVDGNQMSLLDF